MEVSKDKTYGYNDNNSRYTLNLSEFINNNDNLGSEIFKESRDNLDDNVDTVSPQNEIDDHYNKNTVIDYTNDVENNPYKSQKILQTRI